MMKKFLPTVAGIMAAVAVGFATVAVADTSDLGSVETNFQVVSESNLDTASAPQGGNYSANCPVGYVAISGGGLSDAGSTSNPQTNYGSFPLDSDTWTTKLVTVTGGRAFYWAVCVNAQ